MKTLRCLSGEETTKKINYAQDTADHLALRIEDTVAIVEEHDKWIDKQLQCDDEYVKEPIINSPLLTKKQKISHKKHERRKSKLIEQRIALAQQHWKQQNGGI